MAVPAVTLDTPRPGRLGNTPMGVLSGSVNISSYDTAHPAVVAITGLFLPSGKLRVAVCGVSSNGYGVTWDPVTKSFKAYKTAGTVSAPVLTISSGTAATHPLGVNSAGGVIVSDASYGNVGGISVPTLTGTADSEVAGAVNVGTCDFIAVGQLG